MQEKHQKEVERLNKKLKWFAENQELLDKDKATLAAKDHEIKELKVKLQRAQSEVCPCGAQRDF
jgi:protein QN1